MIEVFKTNYDCDKILRVVAKKLSSEKIIQIL